jgi:16S rRNA (cytosine967-C5)-methyltransferase
LNFTNTRELILEILNRVEKQNAYLNILIPYYFNRYDIKIEDKALIQEIAYGVTRFRKKLDWIIDQFLRNQDKKLSLTIRNILRMGVYQVIYLDRIPNYAICNESVDLAKKSRYSSKASLVNAVLRSMIRKTIDIHWPDLYHDPVKYISVFYSFPEWLVKRWLERFGLDLCISICDASNKRPGITLRVNPFKTTIPELKERLLKSGINFRGGQYVPTESLIIREFLNITHSPIFLDGLFSIQDESSMLASRLLNPSAGDTVIDMCSGPGGKTTHLAQLMHNQGKIIAFEKNRKRLQMVNDECQRLGINIVTPMLNDSIQFSEKFFEKADKILVDAPCSGTGVIRKKPDIKWKKINKDQLTKLNQLQEAILDIASRYLKPGGELLYSTCSIEKEENDGIIRKFLEKKTEFNVLETSRFVQESEIIKFETEIQQAIQLLPGYSGQDIDGFYLVKMQKSK